MNETHSQRKTLSLSTLVLHNQLTNKLQRVLKLYANEAFYIYCTSYALVKVLLHVNITKVLEVSRGFNNN